MTESNKQFVLSAAHRLGRRRFLANLGKGTVAFAVVGLSACTSSPDESSGTTSGAPESTGGADTTAEQASTTTSVAEGTQATDSQAAPANEALAWQQVSFGFVSAYLLVRDREVAVVDTGTSGGEEQILAGLEALGASWGDVRHVVLTHSHGDHVGGLTTVLQNAPQATGYAGTADLPGIADLVPNPDALVGVDDGDEVFGLQVIGTPGHTAGHIAVFDSQSGLLVAGDALNGNNGLTGANPDFSIDMGQANASVKRLAERSVDTVLMGHGDPVVGGAGVLLTDLANSL